MICHMGRHILKQLVPLAYRLYTDTEKARKMYKMITAAVFISL